MESVGEKREAWENATRSSGVADVGAVAQQVGSHMLEAVKAAGVERGDTSCKCQRPVAGVRVSVRMQVLVESLTVTDVASKMTRSLRRRVGRWR